MKFFRQKLNLRKKKKNVTLNLVFLSHIFQLFMVKNVEFIYSFFSRVSFGLFTCWYSGIECTIFIAEILLFSICKRITKIYLWVNLEKMQA